MLVESLDGETIARKLLRDDEYASARRGLGAQVGEALARIHAMPSDAVEGLRQTDQLEQFRTVLDTLGEPHPAFELGFRWLEANRPSPTTVGVVHCDFRLGNPLAAQDGLCAVPHLGLSHPVPPLESPRFS